MYPVRNIFATLFEIGRWELRKSSYFSEKKLFFLKRGFLARGKIDLPSCGAKIDEKKPKTHPEKKSKIPDV